MTTAHHLRAVSLGFAHAPVCYGIVGWGELLGGMPPKVHSSYRSRCWLCGYFAGKPPMVYKLSGLLFFLFVVATVLWEVCNEVRRRCEKSYKRRIPFSSASLRASSGRTLYCVFTLCCLCTINILT